MKISHLLAIILLHFSSSYSAQTNQFIQAVEQGNLQVVQQSIENNADYNAHNVYDPHDFSSTDWSLLMKAIARLGSLLIESQSFINTVDASYKSILLPLNLVSVVVSFLYAKKFLPPVGTEGTSSLWKNFLAKVKGFAQSKYFIIPGITTALITITGRYFLVSKIKKIFQTNIENQYAIIQLLLAQQPDINITHQSYGGETAYSLCQSILDLIKSPHLSPPYAPRVPETSYINMLETIITQVRLFALPKENGIEAKFEHFEKETTFKPIQENRLPIVFDPGYDITFFGLEKLHPFDTKKYSKIAAYLQQHISPPPSFYSPIHISDNDLALVHTQSYLTSLTSSWKLGLIADMPFLALVPFRIAARILLEPVKKAVGGTVRAAELAQIYGWSINLSGGYHHAKSDVPVYGGFCIINDAGITAKKILEEHPDYKILIIDLDAHQGNGNADIAKNEKNIAIFDMYNADTWPGDFAAMERINFPVPLKAKTEDTKYLEILEETLPKIIDQVRPDFIIYNAGTDVYKKDPIGELSVSDQGIISRDEFVFTESTNRKIPIMMMLSGGYHKDGALIIGRSIENIVKNVLKISAQ
jgi:histone deacetylase 11